MSTEKFKNFDDSVFYKEKKEFNKLESILKAELEGLSSSELSEKDINIKLSDINTIKKDIDNAVAKYGEKLNLMRNKKIKSDEEIISRISNLLKKFE